ncbi:MAG: aldo/keto reductase [Treponema sp.]|nr:aldo/keto reductase [Treponema sp.]
MEKRKIPSLNAELSLLSFGLMRLPIIGEDHSKIDYPKAQALVDAAIKGGVNYFDTAYVYHGGMSEVFAGDTLTKYPRDSYYLATKMPPWQVENLDQARQIFEEQLKRCKTGYFDFYLVHSLDHTRTGALKTVVYDYLAKKKEEGLIRRLGFSFHDHPNIMKELVKDYAWDFAMIQLNYMDWEALGARILYETLSEKNIPIVAMEPVRGGALANLGDAATAVLKKAAPQASAASWALRYAGSLPNIMTVLSGMSTMEQVEDNLSTFESFKAINDEERKVLEEAAALYRSSGTIPCTDCQYCLPCPFGVEIPRVFAVYNHFRMVKNNYAFINSYRTLDEKERAGSCKSCGKCLELCPQKIDISGFCKEIDELQKSLGV